MFVELAHPQSDDQGTNAPPQRDASYPVMGYVSGEPRDAGHGQRR